MDSSRGVIYISTGDRSYEEALMSIRSLKQTNPGLSVTLCTDNREVDAIVGQVVIIENPHYSVQDKALNIWRTPYQETLYLDSDTFVTGSLDEVFAVL